MSDLPSPPEPSDLVKAWSYLMRIWTSGGMPYAEIERRARDVVRLKEDYSSIPWHARKAERDPDCWPKCLSGRGNKDSEPL